MPKLTPEGVRDLEAAADHFAEVVCASDKTARFGPAADKAMAAVEVELPLSPELVSWYRYRGPTTPIFIPQFGNDRKIYPLGELLDRQRGYRWHALPHGGCGNGIGNWDASWVVIGDEGADPLIAHTGRPGTPISYSMHGAGAWDLHPLAPSLAAYLEAQARWIEACLLSSNAAGTANRNAFDPDRVWDDEGEYLPGIAAAIERALAPVLPADCLSWWL